eukprot:s349_g31.t3
MIVTDDQQGQLSLPRPSVLCYDDPQFQQQLQEAAKLQMNQVMEGKLQCKLCGKYFKGPDYVRKHLTRHHLAWVEALRSEPEAAVARMSTEDVKSPCTVLCFARLALKAATDNDQFSTLIWSQERKSRDSARLPSHIHCPSQVRWAMPSPVIPGGRGYGMHFQQQGPGGLAAPPVYRPGGPGYSQQYAPGPPAQAPVPPSNSRGRSPSPTVSSPPSPTLPLMARTGPRAVPPEEVDFRPGVSFGNTSYMQYAPEVESGFTDAELRAIYGKLDKNRNGMVSKLELIAAVSQEKSIADMLGIDGESLLSDEKSFDELHSLFEEISAGKKGIDFEAFAKHVRKACAERTPRSSRMLEIFNLIDADNSGSISKLELVAAMQNNPSVDEFLMPGVDSSRIMDDENLFEKIDALFESLEKRALINLPFCFAAPTPMNGSDDAQLTATAAPTKSCTPLSQTSTAASRSKKTVYLVRHAESMENDAWIAMQWPQSCSPERVQAYVRLQGALRRGAWPKSGDVVASLQLLNFDLDTPLSRRGERQLKDVRAQIEAASFIQQASPELLAVSPLQRAKRTAEMLFDNEATNL